MGEGEGEGLDGRGVDVQPADGRGHRAAVTGACAAGRIRSGVGDQPLPDEGQPSRARTPGSGVIPDDGAKAPNRDLHPLAKLAGLDPVFTSYSPRKGYAAQAEANKNAMSFTTAKYLFDFADGCCGVPRRWHR